MAYVVRVTDLDHEERYKVYRALPDAREVFGMANRAVWLSERKAAYLYEVPGEDDSAPRARGREGRQRDYPRP